MSNVHEFEIRETMNSAMSRIALLLFAAVTLHVSAEQLTLDQAVAAALEHNAGVRNARLEIEKGQTRVAAAKTRRLPSLELSMIGGEALNNISIEIEETGERIDLARTFSTIGIARITQPVTQLHSIGLAIELNEAALAADKERERAARIAVAREVKSEIALMVSSAMPFNNDRLPRNMTSAGITMSYEPFTWGRREAQLREKRHALEQAENALRDKLNSAAVEIAAKQRKVEEAAAQIAVRRLEAEAARERLRVTKTKFQQQAARLDEMFNANASLAQTAAREQEALSAWWTARADYEKAIGQE